MKKSVKSNWDKYRRSYNEMKSLYNIYYTTKNLDVFVDMVQGKGGNKSVSAFEAIAIWDAFNYLELDVLSTDIARNNEYNLSCTCGCNITKIIKDTECDYYYLENYALSYYEKQKGLLYNIWNRIKLLFNIIIGKEYRLYDIVIEKKNMLELSKWIICKEYGESKSGI